MILAPSDFWNGTRAVVWNVLPLSKFATGARYLKLPCERLSDNTLRIVTTLDDLALIIAYSQRAKQNGQLNGFVQFGS